MLTPEGYKNRIIDKQIDEMMNIYGAVCVEGPKWCGKTWTSRNHAVSAVYIGDPRGNFMNRQLAETDPMLVLNDQKPLLVDEWQVVPALWDAVRYIVDDSGKKGQYVLTGSSTPVMKGKLHGGSGRIGKLQMRTMSLAESGYSTGEVSLMDLFEGSFKPSKTREISLGELIDFTVRGGWPGAQNLTVEESGKIIKDYLSNITDDMERMDGNKRDSRKVMALLRSLGRNESTMTSKTTLSRDVEEYEEYLEEDDYDYEAERTERQAEQDAINKKYQEAFNKDFEKFSTTSDEARINKEVEQDIKAQKEKEAEAARQERVLSTAQKYGVATTDQDGKQRDIKDIQSDTNKAIKRDVNKEVYKNELAIKKIYSDVELECSEKIASAELVDNVAEGTINILGECTGPAGKQVKNWHNFTKATLLGAEEAYLDGRNVVVGTIGGALEGGLTVAQNEMGDAMKGMGGGAFKQTVATAAGTVWYEGTKTVIHDLSRGKDLETSIENAQTSMVKKTGEVAMGMIVGGITDYGTGVVGKNYGGKMSVNAVSNMYKIANTTKAASTEIYSRAHDNMTVGNKNISEMLTEDFNDWKNSKVEQMYTSHYNKKSQE